MLQVLVDSPGGLSTVCFTIVRGGSVLQVSVDSPG